MDLKGFFKKRTELIEQSLREAREAKELAQKALAEVEERLKTKDTGDRRKSSHQPRPVRVKKKRRV